MSLQGPVRHVVVDEQPLRSLATEPAEAEEVHVLYQPHRENLHPDFTATTVESGKAPLYTEPKPPLPNLSEKFIVTCSRSRYLNVDNEFLLNSNVVCVHWNRSFQMKKTSKPIIATHPIMIPTSVPELIRL
ncbi:hypothetical protein QJS10_CPA09g01371 [Acorus calamus]|uniref:Uncharacterized protein n=1 Tax=Acorus calamus TaxID=4465 RepID=A0AAV9E489_ACOCL|nr:hypothetical protein QJS10_CPA09g01371 [Acorus calamus]